MRLLNTLEITQKCPGAWLFSVNQDPSLWKSIQIFLSILEPRLKTQKESLQGARSGGRQGKLYFVSLGIGEPRLSKPQSEAASGKLGVGRFIPL